ncbi:hypothetical protein [Ilumatobacter nonamiensis]|uniref:hypothetical protein n=1 Tax=Ilumatobacter nonamiensis TaxID=467093 RepID=UPI0011D1EB03|nr:hypothetical protein [Ilumatobacter nonamiensis]
MTAAASDTGPDAGVISKSVTPGVTAPSVGTAPSGDDVSDEVGTEAAGDVVDPSDATPENPRDAWLRPFESTSIWNVAIGSGADYVPAGFTSTPRQLLEESTLMKTSAEDPLREILRVGSWRERCASTERSGLDMHLPDGWVPPPVTENETPNNPGVFLQPDGRTIYNLNVLARCDEAGPLHAQWLDDEILISDIYGDGRLGAHGGSGLNQLGGAIRPGELSGESPISHALDLLVSAEHLYWGGTKESSYRWPAVTSDGYASASTYRGANPNVVMGSLVALPPDATAESLGVDTDVGHRLVEAFRDYGAYITDDSGWDATYLGVDAEAVGTFPWGDDERADMATIVVELQVIANNGPATVGGGGTPRQPPLPALIPPAETTVNNQSE